MKAGDMVKFLCKAPRDIGIIVHVYEKHMYHGSQRIDVLWEDGVYTQDAEDLVVVDEE